MLQHEHLKCNVVKRVAVATLTKVKKKKKTTTKAKQKTKRSVANMSCIFMTRKSYFTSSSKYVMHNAYA